MGSRTTNSTKPETEAGFHGCRRPDLIDPSSELAFFKGQECDYPIVRCDSFRDLASSVSGFLTRSSIKITGR